MAASTQDVQSLVTKLRGKGLDDAQVIESLRGMGYTKSDAAAAVGSGPGSGGGSGRSSNRPTQAAGGAGTPGPAGGTSPAGSAVGGGLMPSLPSLPSPTLKPPRRLDGGDLAGFLTGLLLFTLGLNYLRYGASGPKDWLSAKFLNKVTTTGIGTGALTPGAAKGLGFFDELPPGLTSSKAKNPTTVPKD